MNNITSKQNCLLLGVTGGIASGKTAVANMLEEMGARTIDFDMLAREVVEPEKPAWKDIVDYFGDEVLREDKSLDRKKLSDIVFHDAEKRKKLESFTHPRIGEAYIAQVNEITGKHPGAVIQAVVPLLIEGNMQSLFDKLLVVYAPPKVQIKRLTAREGIDEDQAEAMLSAQLPIDEKVKSADFVIYNDKSLDETRKQVEAVWKALKEQSSVISDPSSSRKA